MNIQNIHTLSQQPLSVIPFEKLPIAINIAREEGIEELARSVVSYYTTDSNVEPHLQMLQQREDLVVAEIGVWKGDNAERLCNLLDIEKLYLIDPYDEYEEYKENKSETIKLQKAHSEAKHKLNKYSFVNWIKDYSDQAIQEISEDLDYVYVDGNHSYDYVKEDLENYFEILSNDGILAGDDIHYSGVAQAVTEFAIEHDLQPHFERNTPDWYFIKNQTIGPLREYRYTPENVHEKSLQELRT